MKDKKPNAVVYCEGAFDTTNGKTAHGLVRFGGRYNVVAVVDSTLAGRDAGAVLDGVERGIPLVATVAEAVELARSRNIELSNFVVGLAPDGGRLPLEARKDVAEAIESGLNVDSGLHDFLSEDPEFAALASGRGVEIHDIRKPPERSKLHFFTGDIEEVAAFKIAVLGTDSAVGKRTTAWKIVEGLNAAGYSAEMIGTGQTAWLQGVRFGIVMDSLVNDFVAGEIEHAIVSAWRKVRPDAIVIEGQGSLLNPAYPGGMEILAAGRPDAIVLQHAPARLEYDGFPGYPLHPLARQIEALEIVSDARVSAITINHERLSDDSIPQVCASIEKQFNIPTLDVLREGPGRLVDVLKRQIDLKSGRRADAGVRSGGTAKSSKENRGYH